MDKQNNELGGKWLWIMFVYGALCPMWLFVSKYAKNLLVDGILYGCITFLTCAFTFMILGCGEKFTSFNWAGFIMITIGFICVRA